MLLFCDQAVRLSGQLPGNVGFVGEIEELEFVEELVDVSDAIATRVAMLALTLVVPNATRDGSPVLPFASTALISRSER
jgi:hypothetical protein